MTAAIDAERGDFTVEEADTQLSDARDRAQSFEIEHRGTDPSEAIVQLAAAERNLDRARRRASDEGPTEPSEYVQAAVSADIHLRDVERFVDPLDGPSIEEPLFDSLATLIEDTEGDLEATTFERDGSQTAAYALYVDLVHRLWDMGELSDDLQTDEPATALREVCRLQATVTSLSALDTVVYPFDSDGDAVLDRVETRTDQLPDAKRAAVDAVAAAVTDHADDPLATEIIQQATSLIEVGDQTVDNMRSTINQAETPFWVRQTVEAYANYVAAEHAAKAVEDVLAEATW
ncbi:hypothetical protein [Halorubrum vacuolatum]|uniref:Uncharacterized protein n=1 Tax=Halorubrum vacuolatum TaxID=63740 RepID=A0A238UPV0_HALVU|nr:hypothetical protein [Halorubrum vacuolatum]SNR24145.1 hypothetical protein SAMN06264855_101228 [Halorubrum vacuolatum]